MTNFHNPGRDDKPTPCPSFTHCTQGCRHLGYCTKEAFLSIDLGEVANQEVVRHVRKTTKNIVQSENIMPSKMREWLNDQYRDASLKVINRNGIEIDLPMECFDPTDDEIDSDLAKKHDEALREFFRTNTSAPANDNCRVFVTARWQRHFATMASVVGVSYPDHSRWWPRIIDGKYVDPRVANDNRPPRTA